MYSRSLLYLVIIFLSKLKELCVAKVWVFFETEKFFGKRV